MNTVITEIKGACAHCLSTFPLSAWQFNAIAIDETIVCSHCCKQLKLSCPRQLRRFRSLDSLGMLRTSMIVLIATALLVVSVAEWVGLVSVLAQLNFSLIAIFMYFITLRYSWQKQRMTLNLQAVK